MLFLKSFTDYLRTKYRRMKIGLFGVGHLGKIHLKCLQNIPTWEVVGIYDSNIVHGKIVASEFKVPYFETSQDLIDEVDAIDIVTPTPSHASLAIQAIEADKHVFIEKPITQTVAQAASLMAAAADKPHLKIQVGHVERFNPAMQLLDSIDVRPKFIEVHRLAQFNPRGLDVSVVLDLMIHDLDILLYLAGNDIRSVIADSVCIVGEKEDICNARIEWENGCVANVTASRISLKNMRKMRIFQSDAYLSLDFLSRQSQIIQLHDQEPDSDNVFPLEIPSGTKYIQVTDSESRDVNAIQKELELFHESIVNDQSTVVSLSEATDALKLAWQISDIARSRRLQEV